MSEFSLLSLEKNFATCMEEENVKVSSYIQGYDEVIKFLNLLGTVFGWVAVDVQNKLEVLKKHLEGPNKDKYQTVKSMMEYEVENDMVKWKKTSDASGSRHFVVLHRALQYVVTFLRMIESLEEEDKCAPSSKEAYEKTLMKYHPWVVQKAAKLAMNLLPTKGGLVHKVVPSGERSEIDKAFEDFRRAVDKMQVVYDASEIICQQFNMQSLNNL